VAATAGSLAAQAAIARVAYEDAVQWLENSLEVIGNRLTDADVSVTGDAPGRGEPDRGDLLCALGEAALAMGDPARSRRAFTQAADLARLRHRPELLAMAALGLCGGAAGFEVDLTDPDRMDLLQEAFVGLPVIDSALRSAVTARLSVALTFTGAEHRRRHLADNAVAMARRLDDPQALATALAAQCDALVGPDHIDVRRAAADDIIACARTVHDRTMELLAAGFGWSRMPKPGAWPRSTTRSIPMQRFPSRPGKRD